MGSDSLRNAEEKTPNVVGHDGARVEFQSSVARDHTETECPVGYFIVQELPKELNRFRVISL